MHRSVVSRKLGSRQSECFALALRIKGLASKEVAGGLSVSIHTTGTHTKNLFSKLGIHSRAATAARALKERLV
jgi:DNA-binding CsgD family transcriptional regulator